MHIPSQNRPSEESTRTESLSSVAREVAIYTFTIASMVYGGLTIEKGWRDIDAWLLAKGKANARAWGIEKTPPQEGEHVITQQEEPKESRSFDASSMY